MSRTSHEGGSMFLRAAASVVRYRGDSLARAEDERAAARDRAVAEFRARLVDAPVIVLRAGQMFRSFNPNTLVPLGASGTVYPTGTFQSDWGVLTVEQGGALVAPDNRAVQVAAPAAIDTTATVIQGDGWRLELRPGWHLRRGSQAGRPHRDPGGTIGKRAQGHRGTGGQANGGTPAARGAGLVGAKPDSASAASSRRASARQPRDAAPCADG